VQKLQENTVIKYNTIDLPLDPTALLHGERNPVYLVLDNIRSAFNVGSAFRTGDAALVQEINLIGITAYPPHPKLAKTALNSTEVVPWKYYSSGVEAIQYLKQQGICICSIELTSTSTNFWDFSFPKPIALVFGNEVTGVSDEILSLSDKCLYIPMQGKKTTLNVSTSLGVVLFEVLRQWSRTQSQQY
jgi:tRNA G18 (ribose-2'-O)-methylase SpoU